MKYQFMQVDGEFKPDMLIAHQDDDGRTVDFSNFSAGQVMALLALVQPATILRDEIGYFNGGGPEKMTFAQLERAIEAVGQIIRVLKEYEQIVQQEKTDATTPL